MPGSGADCEGTEPTSCFIIQDHQIFPGMLDVWGTVRRCSQRPVQWYHTHSSKMERNPIYVSTNKSIQRQNVGG